MSRSDVLIVGAGHSGAHAAIALRQHQFTGSISVIGEEPDLPYDRPALSKDYLAREKPFERLLIRPDSFWEEREVKFQLGERVVAIDPGAHKVELQTGKRVSYRYLIWAAGGTPRRLSCSGSELINVRTVRSRADVDLLLRELPAVRRVAVIGGGYIGLEAASVLSKLGKKVIILEAMERVLARATSETISRFYEREHRSHGVDVRTATSIACIEGDHGRASGVRLTDGTVIAADMVIVGIGIEPAVAPLRAAGASGTSGVDIDEYCRTNLPDVFAVGDCAAHINRFAGGNRIRLESVQNAGDQALVAAKAILGRPEPYNAVPMFWSDQYDLKLQTVGISAGYDDVVIRGHVESRSFSVLYLKDRKVIALDCVNSMKEFMWGRRLVEASLTVDPSRIADVSIPLKMFLA